MVPRIVFAVMSLAIAMDSVCAAAKPRSLRLVDDRGKVITGELEVCFQIGTRSDCVPGRGTPVPVPPELLSLRVEGPDHGPVSVRRQDLKLQPDGGLVLTVPRKALLQIGASPKERLVLSLYGQDDPAFRVPSFRREVQGGSAIKVPAGDHLVSLAASGLAPDLHLLSARPGGSE